MNPDLPSERTDVWLFITALCVGGAEKTLVELANGLDADGYDVTVWTVFETNPLAAELRSGIPVRTLTSCGRVENGAVVAVTDRTAYLTVPLRFCYAAYRERPDVIHSFLLFDNLIAGVAGLIVPSTVVTGVRLVPDDEGRVRTLFRRVAVRLSDRIVSNSETGRDLAVDRGADPERVTVIGNGRDVSRYHAGSGAAVRSELDVGEDELVVGTVGRLLERKGHFELLTAWAQVRERGIDARLVLVGDGADREALEARAEELGCADSVEFPGMRDDVPDVLAAMDVFAFPSHYEGMPGSVIEAMAAGLPIVATPVDGTAELLESYRTGLFVPVEAPTDLGWAITRLVESPSLRWALGNAAQRHARTTLTIDAMVDRFEAFYRELDGETTDRRPTEDGSVPQAQ
ncbi:glycosyltransferase [Halobacteriales archaeon QS_6_71_20]|nr:MAG: glycosyltransferase [Halobacteriales archaeon QS_6_71_20]